MKKNIFRFLSLLAIMTSIALTGTSIFAQSPILVEDFTYTAGELLVNNNWVAHSGAGTNSIATSTPGLTLTGYPSSGVGNAASLTVSGEDVNRAFAVQSSGSVYAGFMVNVSEASLDAAGGYFFHIGPDPIGTTFRGRVFIKKDASNNVAFGISKASTTEITYTPFSYSLNTTYLVVVKYTVVDGDANDTVGLFVSTTTPATEPTPTVSATDTTQSDIAPGTVALRQGATATSPTVKVDGIRVGTTWASITQASTAPMQHVVDFNGDGKTDYAVVRNTGGGSGGQMTWFYNVNGTNTLQAANWGISTDSFVPSDYDGDGKTDIAVWRSGASGSAAFYILQSQTNTFRIDVFGQTGDDPSVVGDYDGDGKADPAVYRAGANAGQQSTWYYRGSLNNPNNGISSIGWGQNGDFPAPGDYDGDGKADFVIQRPGSTQATFWLNQTTAGVATRAFGLSTDSVVPGDYDGDAKTDIATARGTGGQIIWYYLPSSGGALVQRTFGVSATDFATQGDYDGDGKTDIAIWRNSTGTFWVLQSGNGSASVTQFGANGDYPVANYNVH